MASQIELAVFDLLFRLELHVQWFDAEKQSFELHGHLRRRIGVAIEAPLEART
jgi:hypothetical protein